MFEQSENGIRENNNVSYGKEEITMEEKMVTFRAKGLFKSAVAVGAGLAIGQYLGGYVKHVINRAVLELIDKKPEAENDN